MMLSRFIHPPVCRGTRIGTQRLRRTSSFELLGVSRTTTIGCSGAPMAPMTYIRLIRTPAGQLPTATEDYLPGAFSGAAFGCGLARDRGGPALGCQSELRLPYSTV